MSKYSRAKPVISSEIKQNLETLLPNTVVDLDQETSLIKTHDVWLQTLLHEIQVTQKILSSIERLRKVEKPLQNRLKVLSSTYEKLTQIQALIQETGVVVNAEEIEASVTEADEMLVPSVPNDPGNLQDFV